MSKKKREQREIEKGAETTGKNDREGQRQTNKQGKSQKEPERYNHIARAR